MAVDSTLFAGKVTAAAHTVGEIINLGTIRGPAIVRDGYGPAYLKKFIAFNSGTQTNTNWVLHVKNSNWVDDMSNIATPLQDYSLNDNSINIQPGHDCQLSPNSGWQVYAVCETAGTETNAFDIFCQLDVEYPKVVAVQNPKQQAGFPVTIEQNMQVNITAAGDASTGAIWNTINADFFKAGSRYLLVQTAAKINGSVVTFVSISGAAGQSGLERIIPVRSASISSLKFPVDYSTPLVKGPMNINILAVGTAGTTTTNLYFDFVKKSI